jgi:hypothetical protein
MKLRLALNWLIAILTVPAVMRGIHEFADGQTDTAIYTTLGLWVAGVCCGYALFSALIGWMERNGHYREVQSGGSAEIGLVHFRAPRQLGRASRSDDAALR